VAIEFRDRVWTWPDPEILPNNDQVTVMINLTWEIVGWGTHL